MTNEYSSDLLSIEHILKDFKIVDITKFKTSKDSTFETLYYSRQPYTLPGIKSAAEVTANLDTVLNASLNSVFTAEDLSKTFNEKIIIVYKEILYLDILLGLHDWLFNKCCDIENITLVVTHNTGVKSWYKKYLELFGIKGFKIVEAPLLTQFYYKLFDTIPSFDKLLQRKNLKYYFSYYGGGCSQLERDFLAAIMNKTKAGHVEYMAGFTSQEKEFDNYLEQLTMFKDRSAVDDILAHRYIEQNTRNNQNFSYNSFYCETDNQSACHVIRETLNAQPFSSLTEKTLRSFLHLQIPIPLGVNGEKDLTKLGFQMNYDIIDYSYQTDTNFYSRINKVCDQIDKLKKSYTLDDLLDYLNDNVEIIKYNYNYIYSNELLKNIERNLLEEVNA